MSKEFIPSHVAFSSFLRFRIYLIFSICLCILWWLLVYYIIILWFFNIKQLISHRAILSVYSYLIWSFHLKSNSYPLGRAISWNGKWKTNTELQNFNLLFVGASIVIYSFIVCSSYIVNEEVITTKAFSMNGGCPVCKNKWI